MSMRGSEERRRARKGLPAADIHELAAGLEDVGELVHVEDEDDYVE